MNNSHDFSPVKHALNAVLPDEVVLRDVLNVLKSQEQNGEVSVELDDSSYTFAMNEPIEIVTKAFFDERFTIGFGVYRVEVALGGVKEVLFGVPQPKHCFATLYYDDKALLLSVDFHSAFR